MRARGIVGAICAVALGVLGAAAPAGAGVNGGAAPLTINKVVNGPVPEGTQFIATLTCADPEIEPNGATSAQVTFNAQGSPLGPNVFTFSGPTECVVTETQTGGAASVSYACVGFVPPQDLIEGTGRFAAGPIQLLPCQTSGPQAEPIGVNIANEAQTATVTITNTFVDPGTAPAAPPVVGAPRFTG